VSGGTVYLAGQGGDFARPENGKPPPDTLANAILEQAFADWSTGIAMYRGGAFRKAEPHRNGRPTGGFLHVRAARNKYGCPPADRADLSTRRTTTPNGNVIRLGVETPNGDGRGVLDKKFTPGMDIYGIAAATERRGSGGRHDPLLRPGAGGSDPRSPGWSNR
jgi:hypothetical protein